MKTSTILLIVLFVISISLISAVPIMFNLKLKNGDFVEARVGGPYQQQKFGVAKFVSLNGLGTVVQYAIARRYYRVERENDSPGCRS